MYLINTACLRLRSKGTSIHQDYTRATVLLGKRVLHLAMDCPPVTKTSRMSIHKEYTCYCPFMQKSPTSINELYAGDDDIKDVHTRTTHATVPLGKSAPPLAMDCPLVTKTSRTSFTPGQHALLPL
jgi:hypothetical protein